MSDGVRHAVPKDAEDIAFIRAVSWQVALEQGVIQGARPLDPYATSVRRWQTHIEQSPLPVLVAVRNSKVVGYASLRETTQSHEAQTAEISSLHVLPPHWLDRVPNNLLAICESVLTRLSFRSLSISVRADNAPMQHLLHELSFQMRDREMRGAFPHNRFRLMLREP